jgi:hypothetical protein
MGWLVSLTLVAALTTSLHAQSADDKELQQYRLTADVLTKVEAVAKAFDANVAKDPRMKRRLEAQRELDALDAKDDLTPEERKRAHELTTIIGDDSLDFGIDGGSLSQISAQLMKIPPMAAALKSTGMPAREMAKFIVTAFEVAMTSAFGGAVPPGAAGDNVKFIAANQAAIDRINKLFGAK